MERASQTTRVLVVDDERHVANTLATILQSKGYETAVAFSGEQAIAAAAQFQPDFLLSDIKMPGINGVEAAMQILESVPNCSVLFISGYASDELIMGARQRGYNFQVCAKPVPPPDLLRRIADMIARPHPAPITILNVDDDEIFRYAVHRILTHAGFKVLDAATGEDALRLAKTKPDVIVLDIHLPDMSGFEVCQAIKADPETAHIPIVHLTNTARDDVSQDVAKRLGADAYFTHPVDAERLCAVLRRLGEQGLKKLE